MIIFLLWQEDSGQNDLCEDESERLFIPCSMPQQGFLQQIGLAHVPKDQYRLCRILFLYIASYTLCQIPGPCPLSADRNKTRSNCQLANQLLLLKHKDTLHSGANCKLWHGAQSHPKKGMRQQIKVMMAM